MFNFSSTEEAFQMQGETSSRTKKKSPVALIQALVTGHVHNFNKNQLLQL